MSTTNSQQQPECKHSEFTHLMQLVDEFFQFPQTNWFPEFFTNLNEFFARRPEFVRTCRKENGDSTAKYVLTFSLSCPEMPTKSAVKHKTCQCVECTSVQK
ncbi:hypothetical protein [Mycoplasmopsis columbinasalis]|uniref:Uncharacterized protein n=1 Tax=Mycoplasmopsis columbinasalis TaxID=114880 RepID=A0A449BA35_9BACT|nr:hypothetical protein [Mycoplasmopsis columbinasalis]VEU78051.1 Uncharacterised protein [Mycoplasmopsis columbinasalis]